MSQLTASTDQFAIELGSLDTVTVARSTVYKTFSHIFSFPVKELVNEWFSELGAGLAAWGIAGLPYKVEGLEDELPSLLHEFTGAEETLAERYTALFDNCTGRARIPMRESNYVRADTKALWEDLVRFYEHFGLDYNLDETRVWPDHLTVQLDMVHYLSFIQTLADAPRTTLMQAQIDFVERHLLNWLDNFVVAFSGNESVEPYERLAKMLSAFVKEDLRYLKSNRE